MFTLDTNIKKIPYLRNRIFTAALHYDSYREITPVIIERDGNKYIVAKHLDRGNLEELRKNGVLSKDYNIVYHTPYFSFVDIMPPAKETLLDAIALVTDGDKDMVAQPDLPLSLHKIFVDAGYNVMSASLPEIMIRYVYKISCTGVIDLFAKGRDTANKIARKLVENSPSRDILYAYLDNREDRRFAFMDNIMEKYDLDAVLCNSSLGVQELTGYGMANFLDDEVACLYRRGDDSVYLFSSELLRGFEKADIVDFIPYVKKLVGGKKVGVEEAQFPLEWYEKFGADAFDWHFAQKAVRMARENRGVDDLSFYIIAARTSAYAIDNALAWAKESIELDKKITEQDVGNKYDAFVEKFLEDNGIPFRADIYFTSLHTAERSITPSFAFDFPVDKKTFRSLKIDAGLSIKDNRGIHHAASDITRTIFMTEEGEKIYKTLDKYMTRDIIPKVNPGVTGGGIHRMAVTLLEKDRTYLESIGMMPAGDVAQIFTRNVGHVLGKQQPVSFWFNQGNNDPILEGMVCTFEFQWSMQALNTGVEDMFIVAKDGSVNITRD